MHNESFASGVSETAPSNAATSAQRVRVPVTRIRSVASMRRTPGSRDPPDLRPIASFSGIPMAELREVEEVEVPFVPPSAANLPEQSSPPLVVRTDASFAAASQPPAPAHRPPPAAASPAPAAAGDEEVVRTIYSNHPSAQPLDQAANGRSAEHPRFATRDAAVSPIETSWSHGADARSVTRSLASKFGSDRFRSSALTPGGSRRPTVLLQELQDATRACAAPALTAAKVADSPRAQHVLSPTLAVEQHARRGQLSTPAVDASAHVHAGHLCVFYEEPVELECSPIRTGAASPATTTLLVHEDDDGSEPVLITAVAEVVDSEGHQPILCSFASSTLPSVTLLQSPRRIF